MVLAIQFSQYNGLPARFHFFQKNGLVARSTKQKKPPKLATHIFENLFENSDTLTLGGILSSG
jgi:hypothetical protein